MEQIWIRRELGEELYKTIESNGWDWKLLRTGSQTVPADVYCRCDIYVDVPNNKTCTEFLLKYSHVKVVERFKE